MDGSEANEVENTRFKLWYTEKEWSRNDVDILIDKSFKNWVIAVKLSLKTVAILIALLVYCAWKWIICG
jgi:hypothetical protein